MNNFQKLNAIDCSEHVEKKGKFAYLSWPWAVKKLGEQFPDAKIEVKKFTDDNGQTVPYMATETGYYVEVEVCIDGVCRSQIHPVLDNYNKTIDNPNAFQVNTSIQRCLVKAIALHGLGLYIYAGEDLPELDEQSLGEKIAACHSYKDLTVLWKTLPKAQQDQHADDFSLRKQQLEQE